MNIGLDGKRFFFNFTGLGNYSRNLVKSLIKYFPGENFILFSPKKAQLSANFENYKNLSVYYPETRLPFWRQFFINTSLKKHKIDLYHGLSHEIPYGIKIPSVVTVHDLIFELYPELFPKIDAFLYRLKYRSSALRADKIIAVSKSTKNDLIKIYNIKPEKITVVYQICNEIFGKEIPQAELEKVRRQYNLPEDFILYVGSVIRRKGLLNIVKATEMLPGSLKIPIVAIGNGKEYLQQVLKYVNDKNLGNLFYHFKGIANEELPAFYRLAKIFIYPSIYEGFGIPVLEAITSGVPVITSNTSSMPEAGGDAPLYTNPDSPEEISKAIEKILTDRQLAETMIEKGLKHAKKFTAERMAKETFDVYKSLI